MAKENISPKKARSNNFLSTFNLGVKKWEKDNLPAPNEIQMSDTYMFGNGTTTIASLLSSGPRAARTRDQIYDQWSHMESDPIISASLKILTTAALGGHETSGDLVFLENKPNIKKSDKSYYICEEIKNELLPLFNQVAFTQAYLGCTYGDAYTRIYAKKDKGVQDLGISELVRPTLVQPFERGNRTVGFTLNTGEKNFQRLNRLQMARLKMQRTQWIPQVGVVEKSLRQSLEIDDIDSLPLMPSMVGGSLLYAAEEPYDSLASSLLGLVGQRWSDSIDEQLITVNVKNLNKQQQKVFLGSMVKMLEKSRKIAEAAVKRNRPVMEKVRHLLPVFDDKQIVQVGNNGTGRQANISIEDIMLHARRLSGSLGVDLSMVGFADQLGGGLGEGGFFRSSAQIGESSRIIRSALSEFFYSIIDVHTYYKYGFVWEAKDRPFDLNYYGTISALESEKQAIKNDAMASALMIIQAIQQLKDMNASKDMIKQFLTKNMMLDEDLADLYSTIADAPDSVSNFGGSNGPV